MTETLDVHDIFARFDATIDRHADGPNALVVETRQELRAIKMWLRDHTPAHDGSGWYRLEYRGVPLVGLWDSLRRPLTMFRE